MKPAETSDPALLPIGIGLKVTKLLMVMQRLVLVLSMTTLSRSRKLI